MTITKSRVWFPLCLLIILLVPRTVQAGDVTEATSPRLQRLEKEGHRLLRSLKLPGLSIAVALDGELIFARGFGRADVEHDVPVDRTTRFRIGSLSKLVTVAAVAKLHEAGRLDLDAPVQKYVPDFPEKKHPITTRQLCCHTSGIRHYGPNDGLEVPKRYETVREGLTIFEKDPLLFEPGTSYSYSSYAYNLVSAVVEGASEKPFLETLDALVCEPLGLETIHSDDNLRIVPGRTSFYHRIDGELVNCPYVDNSYKWAGGGMLSSAEDLVRLGLAHLEPGYFEKETLDVIFAPQPNAGSDDFGVGLGWRVSRSDEGRVYYHHGGAIAGGRAFLLAYPDRKTVVVILANLFARFGLREAQKIAAIAEKEE